MENNKILNRVHLLMDYDPSKTHTENLQHTKLKLLEQDNKFIDNIISQNKKTQTNRPDATYNNKLSQYKTFTEQPPTQSIFGVQGDLYGTPKPEPPAQDTSVYQSGGISSKKFNWTYIRYEKGQEKIYKFNDNYKGSTYNEYYKRYEKDLKNWTLGNTWLDTIKNNPHETIQLLSLASFALGPLGVAINAGLQLYDASLYAEEGNLKMAGLSLVFATMPMASKLVPEIKTIGTKGIQKIVNLISNGGKITEPLTVIEKEAAEKIAQNSLQLSNLARIATFRAKLFTGITNSKLGGFLRFIKEVQSKYPKLNSLFGNGIKIGGVVYSYNKLYDLYENYRINNEKEKMAKLQEEFEKAKPKLIAEIQNKKSEEVYSEFSSPNMMKISDSLVNTLPQP